MPYLLHRFKTELEEELHRILSYWMQYDTDEVFGGFAGRIDHNNQVDAKAEKGSVLNSRILWTFSAAYRCTGNTAYLRCAERAFYYFIHHFIDKEHGGVYWSVDYTGRPANRKKQVYAQSFGIYALSEFYRATGQEGAKQYALGLYAAIERYSYDNLQTGYMDAFAADWTPMADIRLSAKDANEKKTMNTHLHILEGYSNLYRVWADDGLRVKISQLLHNFIDHIIDPATHHLGLFFDENWNSKSSLVSYGHDIEAAWLLQEAAETIADPDLLQQTKSIAIKMAAAAQEGLDTDGGLWYEYEPDSHHLIKEKHWWPQAEAMVGFCNAWQVSGKEAYLQAAVNSWDFIKKHILDTEGGEWVWGVDASYVVMNSNDKVGIWKCPYHNGRACMEIIRRLSES